jgi:hypothetical protein
MHSAKTANLELTTANFYYYRKEKLMLEPQRIVVSLENGAPRLVLVTTNKNDDPVAMLESTSPPRLFVEDEDELQWECGAGVARIEVFFDSQTPFFTDSFVASGVESGAVRSGVPIDQGPARFGAFTSFKYSIIVTPTEGDPIPVDPRVRVHRRFSRREVLFPA